MRIKFLFICVIFSLLVATGVIAQGLWYPKGNDLKPVVDTWGMFLDGSSTSTASLWFDAVANRLSTTNLRISGITGSTQCLQIDTNGLVSGYGGACGGGAGGAGYWTTSSDNKFIYPTPSTYDVVIGGTATSTAPFWFESSSGNLVVSGNVGIGTTGPVHSLSLAKTLTTSTAWTYNTYSSYKINLPSAETTKRHTGIFTETETTADSASVGQLFGLWSMARHYGSNSTASMLMGIEGLAVNQGTGTTTEAIGVGAYVGNDNGGHIDTAKPLLAKMESYGGIGGSITNLRTISVESPDPGAGTITNNYGLYIDNQTVGSALNYSIYTNTGLVHLGDEVELPNNNAYQIQNSSGVAKNVIKVDASNQTIVGDSSLGPLYFQSSGSTYFYYGGSIGMYMDGTTGNVGIGTTTPNNRLSVYELIDFNDTDYNTKIGYRAGKNIVSGAINNTFIGYQAGLASVASSTNAADSNTGIGYRALYANTTGNSNIAIGTNALLANTIGISNSVIGVGALTANTTGNYNSVVGTSILYANTTGNFNSAIGTNALRFTTTGSANTVVGYGAGYGVANSPIANSVLIGYRAGYVLATSSANILLGYQAGDNLTTGSNNIIIGYDIDAPSATGNNQMSIGNLIFATGVDGVGTTLSTGNVGIGTTSPAVALAVVGTTTMTAGIRVADLASCDTIDTDPLGNFKCGSDETGAGSADSDWIWSDTLLYASTSATAIGIGTTTPQYRLELTGTSTAGYFAISTSISGSLLAINNQGYVGIGTSTPNNRLSVYEYIDFNPTDVNTKIGYQAGFGIVNGAGFNTFLGYRAGYADTGGTNAADYNTAVGYNSFYKNTYGKQNSVIGAKALYSNTGGNYNTAMGYQSLYTNSTGNFNTAIGYESLYTNSDGHFNTAIGRNALYSNSSGANNVALGYYAGAYETGSNTFYVDNQNRTNTAGDKTKALLYGIFDATSTNQQLRINASTTIVGTSTMTTGIRVAVLASCDTIDTDSLGNFRCGSDETGAGGTGDGDWFFTGTFLYASTTATQFGIGTSTAPANSILSVATSTGALVFNINGAGEIVTGIWKGTAITDGYIASSTYWNTAYSWGDHSLVGYLTSAITSLNGLSGATQTFASTTDTNIGINIVSSGTSHTFTPYWIGTLADSRIASSSYWNTGYNERRQWDGGSTNLVAATGRTSLGLGTMAVEPNTGTTTITTLGTIATGVWNGTTIQNQYLAATTSLGWTGRVSDETGTGKWVFDTSPSLTTPSIATSLTLTDDDWLGLGSGSGRLVWDDQATDYISVMNGYFGIATTTPIYELDVVGQARITATTTIDTALIVDNGVNATSCLMVGGLNKANATTAGCIILQDRDKGGFSYIYTQDGVIYATTVNICN